MSVYNHRNGYVASSVQMTRQLPRIGLRVGTALAVLLLPDLHNIWAATPRHAGFAPPVVQQPQTVAIAGNTRDAAGQPVSGVRVTLTELGVEVFSDANGHYQFAGVQQGRYTLAARKIGFTSPRAVVTSAEKATYDFVLTRAARQLEPVTVTASASPTDSRYSPRSIGVLHQEQLRNDASISLAHSLVALPGVRSVSTGLQVGKPMIRGLYGARVLTLDDGMRLEDYSWSEEDAPSIDARLAQRVEVIRGPSSVLFGSDAMGGVINVIPEALPNTAAGTHVRHTSVEAYGASNNFETGGSARVEGANGKLGWRLGGTARFGQSIHTPDGEIEHTGFFGITLQGAVGIRGNRSNTTLRFNQYGGEFKLLEAKPLDVVVNNASPFSSALARAREEEEEEGPERKLLDDRVQLVHEQLVGPLRFEAKGQWQRHALIEVSDDCAALAVPLGAVCAPAPTTGEKEQTAFDLLLNTETVDVLMHHGTTGKLHGTVGVSGMYQSNDSRGPIFLVPSGSISSVGAYVVEQLQAGIVALEGSARADHRSMSANANSQIALAANDERSWNATTFNAGAVVQATPVLAFVANVGSAWRAPTMFDLYSHGPHLAEGRYEQGDPNLQREYSVNAEGGVRITTARAGIEATAFHNSIDKYIYTVPTSQQMSGLQLFRHVQADARFVGMEASGQVEVAAPVTLHARYDYVRATNTTFNTPLPLIPPARGAVGATYHTNAVSWLHHLSMRGEVETVARQTRLDAEDFATAGYTLVNFDFDAEHVVAHHDVRIDLRVQNAGNTAYRDFLSRYKQFALDPGRNISLRLSTGW